MNLFLPPPPRLSALLLAGCAVSLAMGQTRGVAFFFLWAKETCETAEADPLTDITDL